MSELRKRVGSELDSPSTSDQGRHFCSERGRRSITKQVEAAFQKLEGAVLQYYRFEAPRHNSQ
jgi:hypothetical protein